MAKTNVCDVCRSEGKIIESGWKVGVKKGNNSVRIDVCETHKDFAKGKTFEEFLKISMELEDKYWALHLQNVKPVIKEL